MADEGLIDALIRRAEADGVTFWIDPETTALMVKGRSSRARAWVEEMAPYRAELYGWLTRRLRCSRCGATGCHLTPAYWGPWLCTPCAQVVAEKNDRDGWPVKPS